MAQSIHDKQQQLKAVVDEVTSKDEAEITKEDASRVMSAEVCSPLHCPCCRNTNDHPVCPEQSRAMDGIRPPRGSTSAHVQSVADHNAQKQGQEESTTSEQD